MNKRIDITMVIEENPEFTEPIGKFVATIFCKENGGVLLQDGTSSYYEVRDNNKNLLNVKILDCIGRHL